MKTFTTIFTFLSICLFLSCEEEMIMIPDFQIPVSDRVVLLEELTGVNCPNCPAGSAKLESMIELFDGKVIGVGIHGDLLTEPISGSEFDFRSEEAKELENSFLFFGKPQAIINRQKYGQDKPFGQLIDNWQGLIEEELNKPNLLNLAVSTEYNSDTRELKVTVNGKAVDDIDDIVYLTVLLSESHIIDAQSNQGEIIPDYEHNHVMRAMLTNWNGNQIDTRLDKEESFVEEFTFTLPVEDGTWKAENIDVVAHVRTDDTIIQAAECHGCLE